MFGSTCASTYDTNTNSRCFLNSRWHLVTIYLGEYFSEIPFSAGSAFNHIITNYIRWMVVWSGRHDCGNVLMIPLLCYFTVLISLLTSPTWYGAVVMFTSTYPSLSATFSNSMSASIMRKMKPPLPYSFITFFHLLLSSPGAQLGICSAVTNLSLLANMIMYALPLTKVTSAITAILF